MKNNFNQNVLSIVITLSLSSLVLQAKSNSSNNNGSNNTTKQGPAQSRPSYAAPAPSKSSTPSYSNSNGGSYKYNEPTYKYTPPTYSTRPSEQKQPSAPKQYSVPKAPSYTAPSKPSSVPNYNNNNSNSYKYNEPTYKYTPPTYSSKPSEQKQPSVIPKQSYQPKAPSYSESPRKPSNTPSYNNSPYEYNQPAYKYNPPNYNKPATPAPTPKSQGYNKNNNYSRPPATNKNGTVLLKELNPGQSRTRADGTTDRVHKDGNGYTHTFVDKNGSVRKESIRYDKSGKEVKISDTERRANGDVVTKYKSGVTQYQSRDGLKYQQDKYGKTVYQETKSTWNNRPVIYRQYNNNYTTVYVQNNYYGTPAYFYRPTYFDYNYYSYTLASWNRPVYYSWHWTYNPWYNEYYRPYSTYQSPSYWLTDYLLMAMIQSNYERIAADNEVMAQQAQYNQIAMSQQIKDEVRRQVEEALRDQQQAVQTQSTMNPSEILTQGRLMVVHTDLNVEDQNGSQCQLDEGDVIRLLTQPSAQNPIVQLSVVSAKGTSCPIGTTLRMSSSNLVEMESEFQSRIQQGMTEMKSGNVGVNQ